MPEAKEEKIITEAEVIRLIETVRDIDYIFTLSEVDRDFIRQSGPYMGAQYLAFKLLMKLLNLFPAEQTGKSEEDKERDRFSNIGKVLNNN